MRGKEPAPQKRRFLNAYLNSIVLDLIGCVIAEKGRFVDDVDMTLVTILFARPKWVQHAFVEDGLIIPDDDVFLIFLG